MYNSTQEVFNHGWNCMKAQGFVQSLDGDICSYRGSNGLKCVAGHFIKDEFYDKEMEEDACDSSNVYWALKESGFPDDFDIMAILLDMQCCHDMGRTPEDMEFQFRNLAAELKLTVPED